MNSTTAGRATGTTGNGSQRLNGGRLTWTRGGTSRSRSGDFKRTATPSTPTRRCYGDCLTGGVSTGSPNNSGPPAAVGSRCSSSGVERSRATSSRPTACAYFPA